MFRCLEPRHIRLELLVHVFQRWWYCDTSANGKSEALRITRSIADHRRLLLDLVTHVRLTVVLIKIKARKSGQHPYNEHALPMTLT